MEDLIRASALLISEDEPEGDFDETLDPEKPLDDEGGEDTDMGGWEN